MEEKSLDDFRGTPSWCYRFMKRQGLTMRVKKKWIAQEMLEDYENQIIEFHRLISAIKESEADRKHG